MPPRYVYWTIIADGQPTAFRSGSLEDIMPTFNRLKEKQPTAELKWFQNGQLWASRHDAQEALRARGGRGSTRDPRASSDTARSTGDEGGEAAARPERAWNAKPEWKTRTSFSPTSARTPRPPSSERPAWTPASGKAATRQAEGSKPEWKPKGSFTPEDERPTRRSSSWDDEPDTENKPSFGKASTFAKAADKPVDRAAAKPEWKPKGTFTPKEAGHSDKPEWKASPRASRSSFDEKPAWKPASAKATARQAPSRGSFGDRDDRPAGQARGSKPPEWKPKGSFKPKEAGHASGWGEKPGWKSKGDGDKPAWKPKGAGDKPAWKPKGDGDKPSWKPKGEGDKPAWKPKPGGSARDQARSAFRPKSYTPKVDDGMTRSSRTQSRNDKLEWTPKGDARQDSRPKGPNAGFAKSDPDAPKRKWVPKAEYKKSLGIEAKRDDKWRPGGEHVDPKQKYKDAKKAKWTRVKATIRARSSKPRTRKDE